MFRLVEDLLGVDLCCDVFLKFLNSNHLSLSDTDSRFAMLARFCQKDTVCHAWHGFASFEFLSYLNSNHLSLFQARACDAFLNFLNSKHLSLSDTYPRFDMLARFCQTAMICPAWHGFA